MTEHIEFAKNHIKARTSGKFDPSDYRTPDDMLDHLRSGKTFEFIVDRIEDTIVHPSDFSMAHNGKATKRYEEAVTLGFLLFTEKLKKWKM
jgi:hypothetical protein